MRLVHAKERFPFKNENFKVRFKLRSSSLETRLWTYWLRNQPNVVLIFELLHQCVEGNFFSTLFITSVMIIINIWAF